MTKQLLGVFDSGLGGLTVLRRVLERHGPVPCATPRPDKKRAKAVIPSNNEGWNDHPQTDGLQQKKPLEWLHHQQAANRYKRDPGNNS